ncbi:thioredoxin domain-containing protein 16 [Tiliqua scincoides]|uniref:thioredoxin domain-containing protein 16 n=1 Tax=Tiliqua scincoides TaxID=71010 RepID=UPI00346376D4
MSLLQMNGCVCLFYLLLLCTSCMFMASGMDDVFLELTPKEYLSSLQASKASLVYFRRNVSPSSEVFLEQLTNAMEALQDYGISVLKVNCLREEVSGYCREDSSLEKAYLFRGHVLLRELPIDALFSVDAIVANVLFALLFHEVKYITTLADLQDLENALKGQSDLVFAYVQATGTAEHRVLMEAAFVYGSLKFSLTTEVMLLRSICTEELEVPPSKLLFSHCKMATDPSQPCRRTLMEQPLTTLNVHKFLKLMGEPIVREVAEDPNTVSTTHLLLGLPLIFVLTQKETLEVDKVTAEFVAWRLMGKAGVVLLSRNSVGLDIPPRYNVALKTAEEGMPVKYLVLKDVEEIVALVESGEQSDPAQDYEEEEEEEEEEDDSENNEQEIQDDEVVESVVKDRKQNLPLELIQTLTEESFSPALAKPGCMVVLFYASWEAVSLVVLQSYVEVAARLKGTPGISLARVNCWDWPRLCTEQNITQFPAIKMWEKGRGRWQTYSGMWGTEELLRFMELSRTSTPVRLTTPEEVEDCLTGDNSASCSISVLGIFASGMVEERDAFIEAGTALNGYIRTGIYCEDDAAVLSHKYNFPLPALLLARSDKDTRKRSIIQLPKYSTQDIVEVIRDALLEPFPEITVENLPEYFQLQKPLLIFFSNGTLSEKDQKEMQHLAEDDDHQVFVACWLNFQRTPVGRGILQAYFGQPLPPLPLLIWVDLHSRGQVFRFPPDQPVTVANVQAWIEKLTSGLQVPSTILSDEDWQPRLPAYDFLSMMEPTLPEFTIYSHRSVSAHPKEEAVLGEKKADVMKDEPVAGPSLMELTGGDLRGTAPRLAAREKRAKGHAEL